MASNDMPSQQIVLVSRAESEPQGDRIAQCIHTAVIVLNALHSSHITSRALDVAIVGMTALNHHLKTPCKNKVQFLEVLVDSSVIRKASEVREALKVCWSEHQTEFAVRHDDESFAFQTRVSVCILLREKHMNLSHVHFRPVRPYKVLSWIQPDDLLAHCFARGCHETSPGVLANLAEDARKLLTVAKRAQQGPTQPGALAGSVELSIGYAQKAAIAMGYENIERYDRQPTSNGSPSLGLTRSCSSLSIALKVNWRGYANLVSGFVWWS